MQKIRHLWWWYVWDTIPKCMLGHVWDVVARCMFRMICVDNGMVDEWLGFCDDEYETMIYHILVHVRVGVHAYRIAY